MARTPTAIVLPGADTCLFETRDAAGRLLTLGTRGHAHIRRDAGLTRFDGDFVTMRELVAGRALHRRVTTHRGEAWTETYRWDAQGRPNWIDGTAIERDADSAVVAAIGPDDAWRYRYDAGVLTGIDAPAGPRRIEHVGGRPAFLVEASGRTALMDETRVDGMQRDALGRVWQRRRPDGSVTATYLWDGFACLARIDGPPTDDAVLAAVYSLDPSFTPVRITTRAGVVRVPRDAFGEGLLALDGPGLHGGMVAGGRVHYRGRALDPRIGAYTAPDPWPGDAADPRRAAGYPGPLPYDPGPSAYAVCRNDPVARIDPTGEVSAGVGVLLLSLSSLTWSSQHTLASMFGLDLLNLFLSLVRLKPGRWFDKEGMSSRYLGAYGLRYDPVGLELLEINVGGAWTYQHVIWATAAKFEELATAAVFVPAADFRPRLHGSILRVAADQAGDKRPAAFILAGSRYDAGATGFNRPPAWSRCGGAAEAALPGSASAIYPRGGLHFDRVVSALHGPRDATITELTPTGTVLSGRLDRVRTLTLPMAGLGLAAGARLMLRDAAGLSELATVVSASEGGSVTRVIVTPAITRVALVGLRVRGLAASGHPALTLNVGPLPNTFNLAGAAGPAIRPGEVFALTQGPGPVGAVSVERVSATLTVDDPVPSPTTPGPYHVHQLQASAGGTLTVVDPVTVDFAAGTAPAISSAVRVGGTAIRLLRPDPAGGADRRVLDRPLPAAISGTTPWIALPLGPKFGVWPAVSGTTTLAYDADGTGAIPSTGDLGIVDGAGVLAMVRRITGAGTEMLVVATSLPGNQAMPYGIERLAVAAPDVDDASQATADSAALAGPIDPQLRANPQPALHILQTTGVSAIQPGPRIAGNVAVSPTGEIVILPPNLAGMNSPVPSQPVALAWPAGTTGTTALALVRAVRLTLTLDRAIAMAAPADGLTLMPLETDSYAYVARRDGADHVQLQASAYNLTSDPDSAPDFGVTQPVQMPRFEVGALVRVDWAAAAGVFRVTEVDGCWLRLAGGDLAPIPAGADIAVRRLRPSTRDAMVMRHGSHRLGLAGRITGAAATTLEVEVPTPAALTQSTYWALSDGTAAQPCEIRATTALTIALFARPGGLPAGVNVDLCALLHERGGFAYAGDYTIDGEQLILPADMPGIQLTPGVDTLVIVPYATAGATAAGKLSGGSTMIPEDDTESWFLTRRESLETHELRHTHQSALMGPLMLSVVPLLMIDDLLARAAGGNLQAPEYSAYVAARIESTGGVRRLTIPDRAGVPFAAGRNVQFVQGAQLPVVELGAEQDGAFTLPGGNMLTLGDGPVSIRLQRTEGSRIFSWIQRIGSILSLGSFAQFLGSTIIMGLPTLIQQIVHAAKGNSFSEPHHRAWYPARAPDVTRPAAVELLPNAEGKLAPLSRNDRVHIRRTSTDTDVETVVTTADGAKLQLGKPPSTDGADFRFEIAPSGDADPTRSYSDQIFSEVYNAEWMGWLYDPWSRLHSAVDAPPDSAKDWIFRTARWAFSSTAWAPLLVSGIYFWDNLIKQGKKKGHLSFMEQQASETSGNLYSSLARRRGELSVVGDIARFRVFTGIAGAGTVVMRGMMDQPGVHVNGALMATLPSPARGGVVSRVPYGDRASAAGSANQVPDQLYAKDFARPGQMPASPANPVRLSPSAAGFIPTPADLEMNAGSYVGFCQAGTHFITGDPTDTEDAEKAEEAEVAGHQTIRFDVAIADVEVRAGGQLVAEDATLTVIPCQRLPVTVTPNGRRVHEVALLRPQSGLVLRRPEAGVVQIQELTGAEAVEVRRVHAAQPFVTKEDSAGAWPQVALDRPIVVPVRRFTVVVSAELPVRSSLVPSADGVLPPLAEARPGDAAFLVIPARLRAAVPSLAVTPEAPAPAAMANPLVTLAPEATPPSLAALVGDGAIMRVTLDPTRPPEEAVTLEWTAQVVARRTAAEGGGETPPAAVRLRLVYRPHFRLLLPAAPTDTFAAGSFDLAVSDGVTVTTAAVFEPDGSASATLVAASKPSGVTVTILPGTTAGPRRILATATDGRTAQRTIVVT